MKDDKRLIEDYLPIQAISKEASREKSTRKGHISTLHMWWARRPLVACRAAVYGALVPASRFAWSSESATRSSTKSKPAKRLSGADLGRAEADKFVTKLCQYPGDTGIIAEAQQHILKAHAERLSAEQGKNITVNDIVEGRAARPKVLDMFAGGGAIPLEAQRLGCETHALDLNPVAHMIELCTLVYPQKHGTRDPNVRGMTGPKNAKGKTTWGGLAEEVSYWGNWVLERVRKEISDIYPLIADPTAKKRDLLPERNAHLFEDGGAQQKLTLPDAYLMPDAYLWTRTVKCKNRACGAIVPLVRQTWLRKTKGRYVALKMTVSKGDKRARFKVVEATSEVGLGFDPSAFSKGGNATCPFCGTVADSDYVKTEGMEGQIGHQAMAIVCSKANQKFKFYYSADDLPEAIPDEPELKARLELVCKNLNLSPPNEPIEINPRSMDVDRWGFKQWSDLFTTRQLLCLLILVGMARKAQRKMEEDGYAADRMKSVATYLGLLVSRSSAFGNSLCAWNCYETAVANVFARQSVPMVWDFAEVQLFGNLSGSVVGGFDRSIQAISSSATVAMDGHVARGSASSLPYDEGFFDAVITDPPYYDNITYSNLSDFFYVWLKRILGGLYPDHFASNTTPKKNEIIAASYRHAGDKAKSREFYESMMALSFKEAHRVLKNNGPLTVVYAHKTTLGWATLVDALRIAGFVVTEAWPLDTEYSGRLVAQDTAALASSIFLVARKRGHSNTGSYEADVQPQLEQIVRERVETLWKMGITGADLVIAAVGAGLRAFTQFERVEYDNGEEVPSERFLAEVEGVVLETMLEKIFGVSRSGVAAVDGPSRFYVLWRYTYKATELDAGEAIVFTYAQPVELDGPTGLSSGKRALVEKKKSKYRLYDFAERGDYEKLGLPNENGESAPLIDVLHRTLWLMDNKPRGLAGFLDEARPDRERLRLVAQALAGPALKGSSDGDSRVLLSTTTAEQAALTKLLQNWRSLIDARLEEFRLR